MTSIDEINFVKNTTTLIIGSNGAGKSTVLDALTFVLFGKAFRNINKPQLVNSSNEKDCLVEIEFQIGTISWIVRRGIKPNLQWNDRIKGKFLNKRSRLAWNSTWEHVYPLMWGARATLSKEKCAEGTKVGWMIRRV